MLIRDDIVFQHRKIVHNLSTNGRGREQEGYTCGKKMSIKYLIQMKLILLLYFLPVSPLFPRFLFKISYFTRTSGFPLFLLRSMPCDKLKTDF